MLASKKVLVVESDPLAVSPLVARLKSLGCELAGVMMTIEDAAGLAVTELPSVVIASLALVLRTESVAEIRLRFAMPVVFVAADAPSAASAGLAPWEYVTRDGDGRELQLVLEQAIQRSAFEQRLREYETRIAETQRFTDVGRTAGDVAHKFNNLLMGVTSAAALMRLELPETSVATQYLDKIEDTVTRAADLCQQLLAAVRPGDVAGHAEISDEVLPALESNSPMPGAGLQSAVLIVDDDDAVRALARWVVEKSGYAAVTARDGDEAITRFSSDPGAYGLVLLDLTMPRMSGEETLVALRSIRKDVPVVIITGYGEDAVREGERAGIAGFLQKPFSPDALRVMLQRCVSVPGRGTRP
jgi:CheY-like chemotaxis protein